MSTAKRVAMYVLCLGCLLSVGLSAYEFWQVREIDNELQPLFRDSHELFIETMKEVKRGTEGGAFRTGVDPQKMSELALKSKSLEWKMGPLSYWKKLHQRRALFSTGAAIAALVLLFFLVFLSRDRHSQTPTSLFGAR